MEFGYFLLYRCPFNVSIENCGNISSFWNKTSAVVAYCISIQGKVKGKEGFQPYCCVSYVCFMCLRR